MRSATILVMAAVFAVWAQAPELRPARPADLAGTWQMVALSKPADADSSDRLFAPYQLFRFDTRGWMKYMTATKPFTSLALFDSAPFVTRYTVDRRGLLTLENPAWDAPRKYACSIVTRPETAKDARQPRAGDLLIADPAEPGPPAWSKLLRKIS